MMIRVTLALCVLLVAAVANSAEIRCYYTEFDVGCDPGGTKQSTPCPATCSGNFDGCEDENGTVQDFYEILWPQFTDLDIDSPVDADHPNGFPVDLDLDGLYLNCTTEGYCECTLVNPNDPMSMTVICRSNEQNMWEEWSPEPVGALCTFDEEEDEAQGGSQ